jgi:flagellar motor switch protein FliM
MEGMLSQDEIDALLEQTREVVTSGDTSRGMVSEQDVKLYDFKRPEKFSREQLRSLERVHERLARLLSTSLSSYIRTNVNVKLESVTPLSYQDYVYSLPQPTLIEVVELPPLPGPAAIEVNPSVVFPLFEQMTGGRPGGDTMLRPLTDIELSVFQKLLERVLQCVAETWHEVVPVKPIMTRAEQDPQFAQVVPVNTPVIVVSLEVTMGEEFGMMSLCLPDVLVDALLHHVGEERRRAVHDAEDREGLRVRDALTDVALPVIVELGTAQLSVAQARSLKVDDVIRLDTAAGAEVKVHVGNRVLFRGRVGQVRRKLAVKVIGTARLPEMAAGATEGIPVPDIERR